MPKAKSYTVSDGRLVLNLEPAEEGGYVVTSPLDPELITQKDDLLARRKPRPKTGELTIADLVNSYLTLKKSRLDTGELSDRVFRDYRAVCGLVVSVLGRNRPVSDIRPEDFEGLRGAMSARWGPVRLGNQIVFARSIFKFGFESGMIETPVRFGPGFKRPSAKTIRAVRQAKGPRLFTPEQLRAILSHATVNMRAMILLGINAGLGNTDLVLLPINAVDLDGGWLDYPRHKTAVPRRAPLWPETVQAIRDVLARRPTPKPEDSAFLFLRAIEGVVCRMEWFHIRYDYAHAAKLAGVEGRGFYDLRRTFQTIAERAWDLVAVQAIMGHTPASRDMSAVYRQKVDDERLQAVADHVRRWLFGDVAGDARQSGEPPILRLIGWV